ncbi:MAG: phosphotransferase enzyme family protein [Kiritimatiellia bacterium]
MELARLINKFNIKGHLVTLVPFGNGNINDTFLAVFRNTFTETQVILQRVNRAVFTQPEAIMQNMHEITLHCHEKLEEDAKTDRDDRVWQMPRIIRTKDGADFLRDENGEVWRVITRILSAHAFDTAQSPEHALECGAALGHFHYLVSDMDPETIVDPLPGFHVTSGYLAQYDETLAAESAREILGASMEAKRLAKYIEERREFAVSLEKAEARGELRKRMFHGDPKVNNIMIDDFTGKGTAMIDLDTVSPGLMHVDVGDAIRSICNPAGEEELNLGKVTFDENLFMAFMKGYLREAGSFMTEAERAYLYDAIRLLPFELGLRFFQDYLAGDIYFKVRQPGQNLNRARVQFRLCEAIEARERSIREILAKL